MVSGVKHGVASLNELAGNPKLNRRALSLIQYIINRYLHVLGHVHLARDRVLKSHHLEYILNRITLLVQHECAT